MMTLDHQYIALLEERRNALGLSCAILAERVGLSLRTVQRALSGKEADPGFSTISAIADALGLSLKLESQLDIAGLRRLQAERKADEIVAMVQGTSGLEAQAVSSRTLRELRERTITELLAGSNRRLWAR
jgi:DNA-binding phage protein